MNKLSTAHAANVSGNINDTQRFNYTHNSAQSQAKRLLIIQQFQALEARDNEEIKPKTTFS